MKKNGSTSEIKGTILIVDDDSLIRKTLKKFLKDKNYKIYTADNGREALKKLKNISFDLVLTDLQMPKMGGNELIMEMAEKFPEIPKIVLTGYGTNDDILTALKTGAYDFLTKPIVDFSILNHSVNRAIEKKKLNDDKNRYYEQLNRINEIISMLNRGKSTEEIFNNLNITLKNILPFNRLSLLTINHNNSIATSKLIASDREIIHSLDYKYKINDPCLKGVYESKEVLNISNLSEYLSRHKSSVNAKNLSREGMKSCLILPLISKNETRGFLIFSSLKKDAYKKDHISFLESIGGQISLSIQRGELLFEIEEQTRNLEHLVDVRTQEILKTQRSTIFALSALAEARDSDTGTHLERMRSISILIAQILKYSGKHEELTNQYLRDLYDASILHDIGKVGIPDDILLKPGPLTDEETKLMQQHPQIGYEALCVAAKDLGENSFLDMAMDVTLYHHEKWDGTGYPKGLKKEEIPLSARIVTIADVYDSLTSTRPYKKAFSHEESLKIMASEKEKFDPEIYKIFYESADEFNKIRKDIKNRSQEK